MTNPFLEHYFAIKFSKVKHNFLSNNSTKYERKLSRKKTVAMFENFRNFVARARNSQIWETMTFDL